MLFDLTDLVRTHSLKIDGVLHLGAHTGEEAKAYQRNRCGDVWWVEADPEVIPTLTAHVSRYGHHVIEACVSVVDGGTAVFHRANNHQSSSLYELGTHRDVSPDVHYTGSFDVPTRTVDSLAAEHGIRANFLNADLQMGEFDALCGAPEFMKGVDYAYMELNWTRLYKGGALIGETDQLMAGYGFQRYDTRMAGNSGWGDGLYARPEALGL